MDGTIKERDFVPLIALALKERYSVECCYTNVREFAYGFATKQLTPDIDVLAVCSDCLISCEVKISKDREAIYTGIGEALFNLEKAHHSFLALPHELCEDEELCRVLSKTPLGLICFGVKQEKQWEWFDFEVKVDPSEDRSNKDEKDKLLKVVSEYEDDIKKCIPRIEKRIPSDDRMAELGKRSFSPNFVERLNGYSLSYAAYKYALGTVQKRSSEKDVIDDVAFRHYILPLDFARNLMPRIGKGQDLVFYQIVI